MSRYFYDEHEAEAGEEDVRAPAAQPAPGKRTLTSSIRPMAPAPGSSPAAIVQRKVERTTGADLSGVRLHTGAESQQAAQEVSARAFTSGCDIHFGAGEYQPGTPGGDRLLAHEMVHVAQQGRGGAPASGRSAAQLKSQSVSQSGDAAEREADRIADAALSSGPVAQMTPVERPAEIARVETVTGNPRNVQSTGGHAQTVHRAPTIGDAENHDGPAAAGGESRQASVRVITNEASPQHFEPPQTPPQSSLYEESSAQQSPPEPGFTEVTEFRGTMAAPMIQEEADPGLYIGEGPTADDIQQIGIGDCYFLAALMSIVSRDPGKITSMMSSNGAGGGSVTFWRRQAHEPNFLEWLTGSGPQYDYIQVSVAVSSALAFNTDGWRAGQLHGAGLRAAERPRASDWWAKIDTSALEVHRKDFYQVARWAPLMEKGFARFTEVHGQYGGARAGGAHGARGYENINGGWSYLAYTLFYGPDADSVASDVRQNDIAWEPGEDNLTANSAVIDQLLLLAGRGTQTSPGETQAPILTATAMVNPLIDRAADAITAAQGDADWANISALRQAKVTAVQAAITVWQGMDPDPAPPAPQPKKAQTTRIGNLCADAVRPGPEQNPRVQQDLEAIQNANPTEVMFGPGDDAPPAGELDDLRDQLVAHNYPSVRVDMVGHSSSDGAAAANLDLSRRRATNVNTELHSGGDVTAHTFAPSGVGEEGAEANEFWRYVEIDVNPVEPINTLHDETRSPAIRAMMDLLIDLRNIGTDHSTGQRNIYGNHVYSIVSVNICTSAGITIPLQLIPSDRRRAFYALIDTNVSTVRLRNPHHTNEPDRTGNNQPTRAEDGPPAGRASDGTFTMSLEEFFRNFNHVDSGVFTRS